MITAQRNLKACRQFAVRVTTIAAIGLMLGACSKGLDLDSGLNLGMTNDDRGEMSNADREDMGKALNYWGRKYAKKPSDKLAALNYAKNLKAAGQSKQAFLVLQQASVVHGNDREIASEYGRLALEMDQVALANKLLSMADDRTNPDWRIVSGRGAALAKLGKYAEAVTMFERAHKLAPSNPTVMNNLAMAHAGNGNLEGAEQLLRQAAANPMSRDKVAKNLALVLKLQGRTAEADAVTKQAAAGQNFAMRPAATPQSITAASARIAQATRN